VGTPPDTSVNKIIPAGAHVVLHKLLRTSCDKKHRNAKDDTDANKNYVQVVLLYKRTHDAPIHPGHWALFGGKLKDNEKPKAAAKREVNEELAIDQVAVALDGNKLKALCNVKIARRDGSFWISYFSSLLDVGIDKLTLRPNPENSKVEGEGLGWFDAEDIHHLPLRPEDRFALIEFFRKHGT
jgi:8-oxo-dGTP pyrophosphatase MutT (NUDIX family)